MLLLTTSLLLGSAACASVASATPPVSHKAAPAVRDDVVLRIAPLYGLGLLHNEARTAQAHIETWAHAHGVAVLPVQQWSDVVDAAARGLDPRDGHACGAPLYAFEAEVRWADLLPAQGTLRADVTCEQDACTLELDAFDDAHGNALWRKRGPFVRGNDVMVALDAGLAALAPYEPPDDGSGALGIGGMGAGTRPERVKDELHASLDSNNVLDPPFARVDVGALTHLVPKVDDDVMACMGTQNRNLTVWLRIDAQGHLSGCEGEEKERLTCGQCVCSVLQKGVMADPAVRGHRLGLNLSLLPRDVVTADRMVVSVSANTYLTHVPGPRGTTYQPTVTDPSIAAWHLPSAEALATCFAPVLTRKAPKLEFLAHVRFDAVGNGNGVTFGKDAPADPTLRACLDRVLRTSQAPCPARADLEATVRLSAYGRPLP
jgi:hypothetical protein